MPYATYLLKRHLYLCATFSLLLAWAVVASALALQNKRELLLIALDENGTRLITRNDDPIFKSEVVSFLREFVDDLYNFTPENFEEKLGRASDRMSKELWEKEKEKVLKLREAVKSEQIGIESKVLTISKTSESRYVVELQVVEHRRVGKREDSRRLAIELQGVTRSTNNPYGIEISKLEERDGL